MEQANHFEFQILYEMCLKNLVKQANRFEFQRSVWDVLEEFDELDSSLVFVSTSFIIGFLWLIGGIGSGFIIIFSFVNESLNPVITTLFGNDLLLSLFIILYSTSMLLFLWVTDSNSRFMCSGLETSACFSILCIVTSLDSKEPLFFISSNTLFLFILFGE